MILSLDVAQLLSDPTMINKIDFSYLQMYETLNEGVQENAFDFLKMFFFKLQQSKELEEKKMQLVKNVLEKLPDNAYLYLMGFIICDKSYNKYCKSFLCEKFEKSFKQDQKHNITLYSNYLHYTLMLNKENFELLTNTYPQETVNAFLSKKNLTDLYFIKVLNNQNLVFVDRVFKKVEIKKQDYDNFLEALKNNKNLDISCFLDKVFVGNTIGSSKKQLNKKSLKI